MVQMWLITAVGGAALTGILVTGAWAYYTSTKHTIETLQTTVYALESSMQAKDDTIDRLIANDEKYEKAQEVLNSRLDTAEMGYNELLKVFQSHNLTKLTASKPGLIENRINDATKDVLEDFERISSKQ